MREIGAFEAKNRLGQLLAWVERGNEITTTRHGKEVARLVPAKPGFNRAGARAAMRRIRGRAEHLKFGVFDRSEWKAFRRRRLNLKPLMLDSSATLARICGDKIMSVTANRSKQIGRDYSASPAIDLARDRARFRPESSRDRSLDRGRATKSPQQRCQAKYEFASLPNRLGQRFDDIDPDRSR
jgi:prevent-host-death family protein